MMRAIVIALMVANLGFWGWSAGWLGQGARAEQREPERLAKQVRPEAVVLGGGAPKTVAKPAAAPAAAAQECLEAGPFNPTELVRAEAALVQASVPSEAWNDVATDQPGTWIVYLGRYSDPEVLARKEEEVKRLRLTPERLQDGSELQPGLVLGRYTSRSAADDALGLMTMRGLQNARVIAFAPPRTTHVLRIERPNDALKAQLVALKTPALGAGFTPCK